MKSLQLIIVGLLLLTGCNLHLIGGAPLSLFIYDHHAVLAGEWYRLISHIFTHVSWHHLLLDGTFTLLLFVNLEVDNRTKISVFAFCGATSLMAAILLSPLTQYTGFCGLSGAAHGLLATLGVLWAGTSHSKTRKTVGLLFCAISLSKSLFEVISGNCLLSPAHLGLVGIPIVHSHLGGAIGGLVAGLVITVKQKIRIVIRHPSNKLYE